MQSYVYKVCICYVCKVKYAKIQKYIYQHTYINKTIKLVGK